ncbi:hypothetical protein [Micavibrio aeruginosavorus]|uniref:hypothetical protein n=1 Tax=Micavibrio aeruginosavorus TaxID=349221 RepID=UPI001F1746DB|nr:hypothetical protein [Micavibrio aeruginosavorus]
MEPFAFLFLLSSTFGWGAGFLATGGVFGVAAFTTGLATGFALAAVLAGAFTACFTACFTGALAFEGVGFAALTGLAAGFTALLAGAGFAAFADLGADLGAAFGAGFFAATCFTVLVLAADLDAACVFDFDGAFAGTRVTFSVFFATLATRATFLVAAAEPFAVLPVFLTAIPNPYHPNPNMEFNRISHEKSKRFHPCPS